ncbi:hypothetical protein HNQ07_001518 [Deinococcus metalli]|uniref:Glycosyl hydrolase family 98 putative carbohydrate-binding module domain-containing protein n=1 Tax=Deinococcus metalli TaxID=1141878 RepID=A0A7W8KDD0_9DEIO|nr:NPCBM/NEW2 domain-containing protein [Deinococcus metalli]MBB5376061.1 hypothetical protein [Deinococcus metalli]GHF41100.1 hypothetical protein GCM10017781_17220 [Deinococcus metalli]
MKTRSALPHPALLAPGSALLLTLTACTLNGGRSGSADGFLTSQSMTAGTTVLSSVKPTGRATFGKDRSAGGAGLTVAGVAYPRGLGVSAPSTLEYNLGAQCRSFTAQVGIDDDSGASGAATFKVFVDGRPMFDSGSLRAGASKAVNVNVEGGETLQLVAEGAGGTHADWADAKVDGCVVYQAPIEVMPYGSGTLTITGNYRSDALDVPAIKISTTQPVVIKNCVVAGRGHLISTRMNGEFTVGSNVTVQNCRGYGLNPDERMGVPGRFLHIQAPASLTVQNDFMKGTSGIYIQGGENGTLGRLSIVRNRALNIDGRRSDGKGGWLIPGPSDTQDKFFRVQFVQLNAVRSTPDAEIAWNRVENEPGYSRVEDNISIYESSGTPGHPIRIHHNLIRGAYAYPADLEGYSGGGIITDGCVSRHVDIGNNTVLETSNHGIAIANGEAVAIHDNRVLGTGLLPDGRHAGGADNGIYVRWARNCSQLGVNLNSNTVTGNTVGFGQPTPGRPDQRSDLYIATTSQGKPLAQQSGNTRIAPLDESITRSNPDIITQAVTDWEGLLGSNGVTVGPE